MSAIATVTMNPAVDLSAATDRVAPERKTRCRDVRRDAGGGGINVARVLVRLGASARALYPAGGSPGEHLHRLLDAEGIESVPVPIAGETRESFTILETATGEQYRFVLPGPELSAEECDACLERLAGLPRSGFVVASGALPPGAPAETMGRIAETAAGLGARTAVDTSGPALAAALEAGVYLVKPNLRELSELTGRALDGMDDWIETAAGIVESGGAQVVALTLGHAGALLVSRERRLFAPPIPVRLQSAVGAGDSFLAALIWRLDAGGDLADAFRHAVAAGTAAVLTPGTELCHRADVERLCPQVQLTEMG